HLCPILLASMFNHTYPEVGEPRVEDVGHRCLPPSERCCCLAILRVWVLAPQSRDRLHRWTAVWIGVCNGA
ncbi:MAG: hypothetical protein AAFX99_26965, partial [Myxococcota bacterium]